MPKLILSMDGLVLKEIVLDKERITIGRKPHNDVQIDNLAISGEHAIITTILNDAFLEDRNSTNGTYVNGQPIKKHVLHNNDVVELGKYRLKYLVDKSQPAAATTDFVETAALQPLNVTLEPDFKTTTGIGRQSMAGGKVGAASLPPGTSTKTQVLTPQMRAAVSSSAPSAGTPRLGVIQVLSGPNAGRELELVKSLNTLGKPGEQVVVITRRSQGYFLTHVEGASFPVINGRAVDAQALPLSDHDVIEIAGVKMEFFLRP